MRRIERGVLAIVVILIKKDKYRSRMKRVLNLIKRHQKNRKCQKWLVLEQI